MQLCSIFEMLGHPQVVYDVFCLVDKLFINFEGCFGINSRHLEVVFQQVDDSLIELLEKRQEVVDQEPECRQQHVIVDFIFHETIFEESVNLLLNTLGFPKQPLFHQKRSQPTASLTGAII